MSFRKRRTFFISPPPLPPAELFAPGGELTTAFYSPDFNIENVFIDLRRLILLNLYLCHVIARPGALLASPDLWLLEQTALEVG